MADSSGSTSQGQQGDHYEVIEHARVTPERALAVLSQREVAALCANNAGELGALLRRCTLAVLSSGLELDDERARLSRYGNFTLKLVPEERGIALELENAPATAFVSGRMIVGIQEQLFAVLRDLLYTSHQLGPIAPNDSATITDAVFRILRNSQVLQVRLIRPLVVCWGGHAIQRTEYDYTKRVGYALGLRGLDVCTGCGPGAMKGPMKGATIAHAKQRIDDGRYIGITEPGIIAAEAPNPIVNQLVIMPDIEKRLEAFVRLGHALIIFPGGVGTTEELLYILGVLAHPDNAHLTIPIVLTGPQGSEDYFNALDEFVRFTLGAACAACYQIIIDDPEAVAAAVDKGAKAVLDDREAERDAPGFNWRLTVAPPYQEPFPVSHESMAQLALSRALPVDELACNLRRAFSGIVAGNVKEAGISAVEKHGPFQLNGDIELMRALDRLLRQFVEQRRMRLPGRAYQPCYQINSQPDARVDQA